MKRGIIILVVFGLFVSLLTGSEVKALPGTGWLTGVQIQNTGTLAATYTVNYYAKDSASVYTYTPATTLAVNTSVTILGSEASGWSPSQPPSGFIGSAVVDSDQPILAIVNETNGVAGAQYKGSSGSTATTVNVPLVKAAYFGKSTDIVVQNIGTAITTVTVSYSGNLGTGSANHAIDPNKMWVFTAIDTMPANFIGAATVSSTGSVPIVAVSNEFFSDASNTNYGKVLQAGNAFASDAGSTTLYAPIQKKNFFTRSTGLQVQNVGASAATITATWTDQTSGLTYSNTSPSVNAGDSFTFFGATMTTPAGFFGSAVVTSAQNIVAIVNESYDAPPAGGQKSTCYLAFNNTVPTTTVNFPLQKKTQGAGANNTGIQIMNVGSAAADILCTYYVGASSYPVTQNIAANSSKTWLNSAGVPSNSIGSAVCTSAQNIIGVANEASNTMDIKNYEGFNL